MGVAVSIIKANEVVPNVDLSSSNQQAPVYQQAASSSLTNFNWLPGGGAGPTQYASAANGDLEASPSYADDEDTLLGEGSYSNRRKYKRKGNLKRVKGRKRNKHRRPEYEYTNYGDSNENLNDYEEEYYDRDDGYGSPKAPSYSAPAPSYEAPAPSYSAPDDSYGAPSYSGGGGDGFNDFLNALAAFLPIGLFLAAIPPNLITITTKKKRSLESNEIEEYGHPFMKRISELGFDKLWMDAECQKQLLCQMTQKGTEDNANNVQKSLNFVAKMFPFFGGVENGRGGVMQEVFAVIQDGNSCEESFHCQ